MYNYKNDGISAISVSGFVWELGFYDQKSLRLGVFTYRKSEINKMEFHLFEIYLIFYKKIRGFYLKNKGTYK